MAISSISFLTKGSQVEVGSHDNGSNGAWYTATVIYPPPSNHTTSNSLVYVEYHNLLSEDGSSNRLREYANVAYVRPAPAPDTGPIRFQVNDPVDAFYKDGWWTGVVSSVVDDENCIVTLENPPDEIRFRCEELRVHRKWIGGKWIEPRKQSDMALRTKDNRIEQATPITGKESSVATSVMKRKSQDLDSNDKASPSRDIMKVDSSRKKKHQSDGQSKGFDSEVRGMTDQGVNKTKDLSHGKKAGGTDVRTTHSLIGKQPENFIPTIILKRHKTSPNDDIMNVDSSKKKTPPSVGQSEGFGSEVNGMTDQASSKTENLSHEKKVDDTDVGTTDSLIDNQIEQATPIIDKQSPVKTSIMKDKTKKNTDSNDETSPSDEIVIADSSTKKKQPIDGQSVDLDSEVSEMADQENGEKNTEMKASNKDSKRKKGSLNKELKSNDETSPSDEIVIADSSSKKKQPIDGQSMDLDSEVSEMADQKKAEKNTETKASNKDSKRKKGSLNKELKSNGETSPSDEIVIADSSTKKKQPIDGQSVDLDSEVSEMADQKNNEMKASNKGSKRKKGSLNKELKSLQASTKGSEVDLFRTRTQEIEAKKDATKNFPLVMDLQCNAMTVPQGKMVQKSLDENTSNVAQTDTKQPDVSLAPLAVVNKEGSEGDAASVPLKRKAKKNSSRKAKRGKRRTISVNTETPAQGSVVSEDASKEKADGSLEKDSTRNPEASVGKSPDTVPDDQPILRRCEGNHSPVTISNQQLNLSVEGTVEESTSRASVGILDLGNLPFIRSMALWKTLESMEAFQKLPQRPHFRPLLDGVKEGAREGLAIGAMVTFATTVDQVCSLNFDDPRSTIEDCLETLVELEDNGFAVEVLRQRLTEFLSIKDKHEKLVERSKGFAEEFEERNKQDKIIEEQIEEMNRQIRELEEIKALALDKKEKRVTEIGAMEAVIEGIKQEIKEVDAEFDRLTKAPFV